MIIVQLTANTIASASFFNSPSARVVGGLFLQKFCTITSMARTNAASVKSTVRFRGRDRCQYIIPAKELPNEATNVVAIGDILRFVTRSIRGSNAFLPPRMMTQTIAKPSHRTPPFIALSTRETSSRSELIASSFLGASTFLCLRRLVT